MEILLLLLIGLGMVAALAGWVNNRRERCRAKPAPPPRPQRPPGCCGLHEVCERAGMQALDEAPVYYDDEELDAYRGRPAKAYSAEEVEAFEDVLQTMQPSDVPGWLQSLARRGINLPDDLRDEALMIIGELAEKK